MIKGGGVPKIGDPNISTLNSRILIKKGPQNKVPLIFGKSQIQVYSGVLGQLHDHI